MENIELDEDMEMPVPCKNCSKWFELNDGYCSEKWFPNTTICPECHNLEEKEIQFDEEIENLLEQISDAEFTIKDCKGRLKELNYNL